MESAPFFEECTPKLSEIIYEETSTIIGFVNHSVCKKFFLKTICT